MLLAGLMAYPLSAAAQVVVVSSSVQERTAALGETYDGRIRVQNQGSEATEVRVYQTDYLFHADGRTLYSDPASHARSNAHWIRVSPTSFVLPAGQEMAISYDVSVPESEAEAPTGSHWSMVMIEPIEVGPPDGADLPGIGLRTVRRFGIQIATHVGEAAPHRMRIEDPRLAVDRDGARHLEFAIANDGQGAYRPEVSVEVYSDQGIPVTTLQQQRGLIYPGTSVLQRFDLADLQEGAYQALVIVDTGGLEMFGAQFKLNVTSNAPSGR